MASAGTFALLDCEPRQGRKAATVVIEQARSAAGRGHPHQAMSPTWPVWSETIFAHSKQLPVTQCAAGFSRLNLLLVFGDQRMAIEVKVWRTGRKDPLIEGLLQMQRYLHRLDLNAGFLVIFDQRSEAAIWEQRMQVEGAQTTDAKSVVVLRL